MLNNKPTGTTLIHFLVPFILGVSLAACSSAPEKPAPAPEPKSEPVKVTEPTPPPAPEPAPVVELKPDYPERYVVKKGDTLWGIAERFLKDPWLWPQVWHINPEIRNPHLIYPGEVIALHYVDGKPYLTLEGAGGVAPPKGITTVKLSPRVRTQSLDKAIDTIPRSELAPFLYRPGVVTQEDLDKAPYIVSSRDGHLVSGPGNTVYATNVQDKTLTVYNVVKTGDVYRDPKTGEVLGYQAVKVADATVTRWGEPVTMVLSNSRAEVLDGNYLLPTEKNKLDFNFFPYPPKTKVNGEIIAAFNALSQIGQYAVVAINRGEREGLKQGHILAIYQRGEKVRDPRGEYSTKMVQLPNERAGLVMVFKVYEKVSYALVMDATRPIHINDEVANP
ncbi:MAG: LysM peptidoglycan-binding domain-containing protein [Proteobacteria bacterium]|jgi:LysM repeat protein|nr:LysM peptidoglycan-binding domain-containing protein [Pseudomonadota bacterium]